MKYPVFQRCDQIRETAFSLPPYLRYGHLEKVYETGLCNRLEKLKIPHLRPHSLRIFDEDDSIPGEFNADILVAD